MACKFSGTCWRFPLALLCLMTGSAASGVPASAQGSNAAHENKVGSGAAQKEFKFEVASIRPVATGSISAGFTLDPTPNGFSSTLVVWQMLMIAYAADDRSWNSIPLVNAPKWFSSPEWYVVNARVADEDGEAWRHQSNHHELLRSAMRNLLKERCQLLLHEEPTMLTDYKLVIEKSGLRMKATVPGSTPPKEGHPLPSGGVRFADGPSNRLTWHYYGATIGDLLDFLSPPGQGSMAPPRVHDETGLTGRFDFALTRVEEPSRDHDEVLFNYRSALSDWN